MVKRLRTYARKFVIAEKELDTAFEPPALSPSQDLPDENVLSVWLSKLAKAHLDEAVLSDASMPRKLELIEAAHSNGASTKKRPRPTSTNGKAPFLRTLELAKYREYPSERKFDFGSVNLIVGVNGSGKTSLLEAIELAYCGRNKRNPDANGSYTINLTFSDGTKEEATSSRPLKTFRDRNLKWYGQSELKTNNLCLSFAQFNFLDTDAAVRLAEQSDGLEEDLSKLLVGPEVSKVWKEIERLHEAVSLKLKDLRHIEEQLNKESRSIDIQLKATGSTKLESDAIFGRVEEMIQRTEWPAPSGDRDTSVAGLMASLSELESLAKQAAEFQWADSPVSLGGLRQYAKRVTELCATAENDLTQLRGLEKEERELADEIKRCQSAQDLAIEAGRMVEADLAGRAARMKSAQSALAVQTGLLAGCDESVWSMLKAGPPDTPVDAHVAQTRKKREAAEKELERAKSEHEKFSALLEKSIRLAQELRDVASQLLANSPTPDQCPLCHTDFKPGELQKHIQLEVAGHAESRAQALLAKLRECIEALRIASIAELAADWISQFCKRVGLAVGVTLGSTLSKAESVLRAFDEAQRDHDSLKAEISSLELNGLSLRRMEDLRREIANLGYPLPDFAKSDVDQLRETLEDKRSKAVAGAEVKRKEMLAIRAKVASALSISDADTKSLSDELAVCRERLAVANKLSERLTNVRNAFPWSESKPLSEVAVDSESLRRVAAEFQHAVAGERQSKTVVAQSTKRRGEVSDELSKLKPRIDRYSEAEQVLEALQSDYSLTKAMQAALKHNRNGIESIFGRIHSPAEFAGLGTQISTLIRKTDGAEAKLSQISTGQRSAFALSIFLAQNGQLKSAPPVLLIDDPIAHIDDLNALSFLDYLREIALGGNRQILFATANAKIAELFERKFDFLGKEEFKRIDLCRQS